MSFLLIIYLFLPNGDVKIERYPQAAATMNECLKLASEKRKTIWEKNNKKGNPTAMCVPEGNK